jgi:hypothetical protein
MAKTRCNESNLDLISCDRGSFSLSSSERGGSFEISIPIGVLFLGSFKERTSRSITASLSIYRAPSVQGKRPSHRAARASDPLLARPRASAGRDSIPGSLEAIRL